MAHEPSSGEVFTLKEANNPELRKGFMEFSSSKVWTVDIVQRGVYRGENADRKLE